jgi:hypothetical protein
MPLPVTSHGSGVADQFVPPEKARVRIPLGHVDRESGIFNTPRGATRDLRNVILEGGQAHLRSGMASTSGDFPAEGYQVTDIIGIRYLSIDNTAIVVAYSRQTEAVYAFKVDGDGEDASPVLLGKWFDFAWDGETLPVVTTAESANKIFMAHDETVQEDRAPTFVYSPQGGLPTAYGYSETFGPLLAPWDTNGDGNVDGDDTIHFRGVVAYLDYLVGWGWGNNLDMRPEMVRISLPGEPILSSEDDNPGFGGFDPGHWVIAGSRGSPVLSCAPAGNVLLVMKPDSTYPLVGTSPATFGVGPAVDQNFGIIGPNLWAAIDNQLFVWTHEGPKYSTGGAFQDASLPLDLDGPAPEERDIHSGGFGIYIPRSRVVVFVFDDWAYVLNTRTGEGGWSYWDLGVSLRAAEVLYVNGASTLPMPVAGPWVNDVDSNTDTSITVDLDVSDGDPATNIQVWYRKQGDALWTRSTADEQYVPAGLPTNLLLEVTGLEVATAYDLAFRFDKQGVVHDGETYTYTGLPQTWPGASRVAATTAGADLAVWSRVDATTEKITLTFVEHEVSDSKISKSTDGGQNWTEIANDVSSPYDYTLGAGEGEIEMDFMVEYPLGAPPPDPQIARVWTGPIQPRDLEVDPDYYAVPSETPDFYEYVIDWVVGAAGSVTEVEDNYSDTGYTNRKTTVVDATTSGVVSLPRNSILADGNPAIYWQFTIRVRHKLTQYGVDDYSDWSTHLVVVLLNYDEDVQEGGGGGVAQ